MQKRIKPKASIEAGCLLLEMLIALLKSQQVTWWVHNGWSLRDLSDLDARQTELDLQEGHDG